MENKKKAQTDYYFGVWKEDLKTYTGDFMYGSLSQFFHENTKQVQSLSKPNERTRLFPFYEDVVESIHFKTYPRFKKMTLKTSPQRRPSIQQSILNSRPVEKFTGQALTFKEISEILFYSAGITYKEKGESKEAWDNSRRPYPSLGARYPLELYPVILRSSEADAGIYHYNVKYNTLEFMMKGDYTNTIIQAIPDQEWIRDASMVVLLSAIFKRTEIKYGDRGYRYVLLEAGHLAQNIYLIATSMKLGCCTVGAFHDDELNELLDLDGTYESVIYCIVIGAIKQSLTKSIRSLRLIRPGIN